MSRGPRISTETAHRIERMHSESRAPAAIAKALAVSPSTVYRVLSRTRERAEFRRAVEYRAPRREQPHGGWSLQGVRSALSAQARGDFKQAVRLAESMRTDNAIFVARDARLAPQDSIAALIKPASQSVRAEAVARKARLSVFTPRSVLKGIHGTLVDHGIAIGWVDQVTRDDATCVDFHLHEWPLEHVQWDSSRELLMTSVRGGLERIPIVHGDGFWVVFRKFNDRPWCQDACLLPGAFVWAGHAEGLRDWQASSASHGLAKIIGELPDGISLQDDETGSLTPEALGFLNMLRDVVSGVSGAAIRPAGSKTEFLANASTAWQVFHELIQNREKAAARIYTGTDAVLGSSGGAPGVDIAELFGIATTKLQGDFQTIESAIYSGVLEPWCAVNEGDSKLAPRLEYQRPDSDSEKKGEQSAAARERMFAAIDRMKSLGMVVDQDVVNGLAQEFNVDPVPQLAPATERAVPLVLAPTDVARVVRGIEARASQGLPPFGDERDNMTIPEIEAAAAAAKVPAGAPVV